MCWQNIKQGCIDVLPFKKLSNKRKMGYSGSLEVSCACLSDVRIMTGPSMCANGVGDKMTFRANDNIS